MVEITAFADIVGECETLEFNSLSPSRRLDMAVSQRDDDQQHLYFSINGQLDLDADYVLWAIQYAKDYFVC